MLSQARTSVVPSLQALIYLDSHILQNRIRLVLKDPKRLVLWSLFLLWLLLLVGTRLASRGHLSRNPFPPIPWSAIGIFIPGTVMILLAMSVMNGGRGTIGFRSPTDARFLSNSALSPRVVSFWLCLRSVLAIGWRLPIFLVFYVSFFLLLGVSIGTVLAFLVATALLGAVYVGMQLPLLRLNRKHSTGLRAAAWIMIALGLASIAIAGLRIAAIPWGRGIPAQVLLALPPGSLVEQATHWQALVALAGLALLALWATASAGVDVYPELYDVARRRYVIREVMRNRGGGLFGLASESRRALRDAGLARHPATRKASAPSAATAHIPGGAWAVLWKEWIVTRRYRWSLRLIIGGSLVAILVGIVLGSLIRHGEGRAVLGLITPLAYLVIFFSFFTAVRLGNDLRNPIWWLSAATLRNRLLVLTLSRTLRIFLPLALGTIALGITAGSLPILALAVPGLGVLIWDLRGIAVATYAILPSAGDLRGPGVILRVLIMLGLVLPLVVVAGLAVAITRSAVATSLAGFAFACLEGAVLIGFASWRIRGNGIAFGQAEQR